ncbi:hypothetical protein FJU30_05010 [Affinibrenneria salicis]|uniref:Prophage protein n=1 Tax=Affinibrenneria salicis TaxID=2590031 RepID=A0A5J5G478_9GAMM|nr:hypothetical protein [Affinibrenneria salicis]KAA9001655.1 hypothetical protein FJU30_05010 [Affinibrenneria salicis]
MELTLWLSVSLPIHFLKICIWMWLFLLHLNIQQRGLIMFNNTPLELEEIIDQCRALIYAVVEIENPQAKEILSFVLWERLNVLYQISQTEKISS